MTPSSPDSRLSLNLLLRLLAPKQLTARFLPGTELGPGEPVALERAAEPGSLQYACAGTLTALTENASLSYACAGTLMALTDEVSGYTRS